MTENHDWTTNKTQINERDRWLSQINWEGKTVVDYGTGGGHGEVYLHSKGATSFVCLDVSDRSITNAKDRITKHGFIDKCSFHRVDEYNHKFTGDAFVTHAVIQHFPDIEYTKRFFSELDKSGISELAIQFRYSTQVSFSLRDYSGPENAIKLACHLNLEFLLSNLPNYTLRYRSEVNPKNAYIYTVWEKKT